MAVLYISEYEDAAEIGPDKMPMASEPEKTTQTVAIGGSSTQSAAFGATTVYVRLHADVICSVKFGTNPTATATTKRMAANQTEYFGVQPGTKGCRDHEYVGRSHAWSDRFLSGLRWGCMAGRGSRLPFPT